MKNLKVLLIVVFTLVASSFLFTLATPTAYADYCGDKYPKPWQEPDRIRCRLEQGTGRGGSDADPGIFNVKNGSDEPLSLAVTYYRPPASQSGDSCLANDRLCKNGGWVTKGWFNITPGQTYQLFKNYHNAWLYLYADSNSYVWSGSYPTWVVSKKFTGGEFGVDPSTSGAYKVEFFQQHTGVGNSPYTLTLN